MDFVLHQLSQTNIPTLLVIVIVGYFFYNKLKKEFKEGTKEIRSDIKTLDDKVNNIDKRLVAVETILRIREFQEIEDRKIKKVGE